MKRLAVGALAKLAGACLHGIEALGWGWTVEPDSTVEPVELFWEAV